MVIYYRFPSGPFETNAILLACPKTKRGAVIDPALGSADPLLQKAKEEGLAIEKILLTHSHWDHFADAYLLKEKTKAPLFVHFADAKNLEQPGSDQIPFFIPGEIEESGIGQGGSPDFLAGARGIAKGKTRSEDKKYGDKADAGQNRLFNHERYTPIHPVKPDQLLKGGETLQVGELKLEVIHTPGHSPGGVCFYLREQKLLFSGDTLFQGAIGNLQLPTAQPSEMWHSLEKLAQLPAETRVVPGHGEETTIGEEKWLPRAREIFSKR